MKKGFTLIEMLVVVLIIGILAGIALPQYNKAVWKARFAEVYTVVNALEKSIESYMLSHTLPSDRTYLTPEDLDINVLSNLTEKEYNHHITYCSKYLCRFVACTSEECYWYAIMYKNTANDLGFDTGNPIAEMQGHRDFSGWYRSCWYEGETANIGKYLCESTNWDDVSEGF